MIIAFTIQLHDHAIVSGIVHNIDKTGGSDTSFNR
jgi:hypothetical protein